MRVFSRCVFAIVALLAIAPVAAQGASGSEPRAKGANCFGKPATLQAKRGQHLLVGTPGADVIVGSRTADEIRGRGGNDLICGGGGNDLLAGGGGQDRIRGGSGADFLLGGAGADQLTGDSGDDRLDGGGGQDRCAGNAGANTYVSCEVEPTTPPSPGPPSGSNGGNQLPASNDGGQPAGPGDGGEPAPVDHLPIAADDASVVGENSAATFIDVLSNDTDSEGDPITVDSITQPENGTVEIATEGTGLTYEPSEGYCNDGEASDTFTYTLNGGSEGTVSVEVTCVTTLTANPALTPAYDPAVTDYTTRCTGAPLEVSGRTAEDTTVAIDGEDPVAGKFATTMPLEENQGFSFTVTDSGGSHLHYVRCLPAGFPPWEFEKLGQASHDLYITAPTLSLIASPTQYV